jgi:hypothetical protein
MKRAVLDQILRGLSRVTAQGDRFVVADGFRLDLLGSAGQEILTLPQLKELTLGELYLTAITEKDETYYLEYDLLVGVRVKSGPEGKVSGRAGFSPA